MGYTNYWTPKYIPDPEFNQQFWVDAASLLDIVLGKGIKLATWDGETQINSSSDILNSRDISSDWISKISFNGFYDKESGKDESHESFVLSFDGEWNFCKTAEKPYDLAVKLMLMLADKYGYLKEYKDYEESNINWSFDGNTTNDPCYIEAKEVFDNWLKTKGE